MQNICIDILHCANDSDGISCFKTNAMTIFNMRILLSIDGLRRTLVHNWLHAEISSIPSVQLDTNRHLDYWCVVHGVHFFLQCRLSCSKWILNRIESAKQNKKKHIQTIEVSTERSSNRIKNVVVCQEDKWWQIHGILCSMAILTGKIIKNRRSKSMQQKQSS